MVPRLLLPETAAMIDKSRPAPRSAAASARRKPRQTLPAFTPVPRQTTRHDGWTPERQSGFIAALADTGSVRHAAHAVNMTPEGAYLLRRHPEGGSFRKAWTAALALGVQRLEDVAMERALNGVEVPVYSYGKLVGTRRVTNDALLMFLLRNRAPHRFSADSVNTLDAASRSSLERLKREWRQEWEAERQQESARLSRPDRLDARFAALHTSWVQDMNAETLRYYKAFRLARRAQDKKLSLAELGIDPFDPQFDIDGVLRQIDCDPPTHIREQGQELGADLDTAQSYLTPKPDWRDDVGEDQEEEEE